MKTKQWLPAMAAAVLLTLTACGGGGSSDSSDGGGGGGTPTPDPTIVVDAYQNVSINFSKDVNWEGACGGNAPGPKGDTGAALNFPIQGKMWVTTSADFSRAGEKIKLSIEHKDGSAYTVWHTQTSQTLSDGCGGYATSLNFSYSEDHYFPSNDPNFFTHGQDFRVIARAILADGSLGEIIGQKTVTVSGDMMPYTEKNPEGFKVCNKDNVCANGAAARDVVIYEGEEMRLHADFWVVKPADMCIKVSALDRNRKIYVLKKQVVVGNDDPHMMWDSRGTPPRDVAWYDGIFDTAGIAGVVKTDHLEYLPGYGCGYDDGTAEGKISAGGDVADKSGYVRHLGTGNFVVLSADGGSGSTIVIDGVTVPYCPNNPVTSVDNEGRSWGWNGTAGCFVSY